MKLEQAVFAPAPPSRGGGYQLLGTSAGLRAEDAAELCHWGPTDGALHPAAPPAGSLNFHPLPSGAWCIARTMPLGAQSDAAGPQLYTQSFIAPPAVMANFAHNPFAVVRAVFAEGGFSVCDTVPERLPPLPITGRTTAVDQLLLARLVSNPGPRWMGRLVDAALNSACLVICGGPGIEYLLSGMMSCLPPECRGEFSFTTGLRFALARPFRIVAHPGPPTELDALRARYNLTVLDLSQSANDSSPPIDGWGRLVEKVLASGRTAFLAQQLAQPHPDLTAPDLSTLGLEFLDELDAPPHATEPAIEAAQHPVHLPDQLLALQRAHAAHRQMSECSATATLRRTAGPSHQLDPDSPEILEKLERLDDAVFDAVEGKRLALATLRALWPEVCRELGDDLLAESRAQYLRYALHVWDEYAGSGGVRDPSRAIHAMDVLCVLFDEV